MKQSDIFRSWFWNFSHSYWRFSSLYMHCYLLQITKTIFLLFNLRKKNCVNRRNINKPRTIITLEEIKILMQFFAVLSNFNFARSLIWWKLYVKILTYGHISLNWFKTIVNVICLLTDTKLNWKFFFFFFFQIVFSCAADNGVTTGKITFTHWV